MDKADVSVIIPSYNSSQIIGRALQSIVYQSQAVKEVIIVDDGSKDVEKTRQVVAVFENQLPIKFMSEFVNRGAPSARNKAIRQASGKYIAFLDTDDIWLENKVHDQYNFMEEHKASLSAHRYIQELRNDKIPIDSTFKKVGLWDFSLRNIYFTPTVMALRSTFIPFDERFRRNDDYKCWIENISENKEAYLLNAVMGGGFKPAIGHSGLTGSIISMHTSFLAVLKSLFVERKISFKFYFVTMVLEYIKLPRRFIKRLL